MLDGAEKLDARRWRWVWRAARVARVRFERPCQR